MNNFIGAIDSFKSNDVYYVDTDSMYIENKHWDKLKEAGLVGKGKNQYGNDCGIFFGLLLAPKIKHSLTIEKNGVIEQKTFKGFSNVEENFDRKEYFKKLNGDKLMARVPLSWKHNFDSGVIIPHKQRYCSACKNDSLCNKCDKLINQTNEFLPNLKELKRRPPNSFGHMLPWCINILDEYLRRV